MFSKLLSASALMLLSSQLVAAQTSSSCNPVKGDKCPDDPAFGGVVDIDFTQGASKYFTVAEGTTLSYDSNGAAFSIEKETNAPTITSTKYLFFGTVEAVIQVAPGTGIVTSFVLQSDDLDEIDWEWLGGDTTEVQTNYFSKGDTTTYDRGGFSNVNSPQTSFHTYTIDWSPEAVVWSVDGATVRTLTYNDAKGGTTFPQTPMQIKLGTWDGGASTEPEGTVKWAGGYTPFNGSEPYIAYYKSIKITDRSNGVQGATAYAYKGTSGTYDSIDVKTDGSSSSSTSTSASSSTSTSASSTKSSSSSSSATAKTSKTSDASSATTTASSTKSGSTTATTMKTSTTAATSAAAATGANSTTTASSTSSSSSTSTSSSTTATAVVTSGAGKLTTSLAGAAAMLVAYILI